MRTIKHLNRSAIHHAAKGFSLVELMISLVIGLVIMIATMTAYVSASGASKISDAQSRMNEDGQAALTVLAQQIRMAGTNPVQVGRTKDAFPTNPVYIATYVGGSVTVQPTSFTLNPVSPGVTNYAIRGCDGTFGSITSAANIDALTCGGTSTLPDSLAVSYEADKYNTEQTTGGLPTDCVGGALTAIVATFTTGTATTANYSVADNRFYIADSSGVSSLFCKGNGGGLTQPLVENIEDMQFEYGAASATDTSTTATIAGYLTADQVVTETTLAALANIPKQWGKVLAVRICVVARSATPVLTDTASSTYVKCDGSSGPTVPDLYLRRAYSTTVVLRNRRF
jgi:type IV pilus assembly protein PilW